MNKKLIMIYLYLYCSVEFCKLGGHRNLRTEVKQKKERVKDRKERELSIKTGIFTKLDYILECVTSFASVIANLTINLEKIIGFGLAQ